MLRRLAMVLGIAWALVLGTYLINQVRMLANHTLALNLDWAKQFGELTLLYGTLAVLCFAVASALKPQADSGDRAEDADRKDGADRPPGEE